MKYEYNGLTITIEHDDHTDSPRDWDNLGIMVCGHKQYNLGDTGHGFNLDDFSSWQEVREAIVEREGDCIILPLWLYAHSGISMSCGSRSYPYDCPWDSGQVGFIYVPMGKVIEEWKDDPEARQKAEEVLRGEVTTYDQYLRGEVLYYSIEDEEGNHLDSCGGFYGLDHCKEEAESMADWHANKREEELAKLRPTFALGKG